MKKFILINVSDLRKHPSHGNIYVEKSSQFDALVESIKETGELLEPIIITADNVILSGVQRWNAYKELGKEVIPAYIYDGDLPMELISLIIAHNQQRVKTSLEIFNEISHLGQEFGNKQGQRTDLKKGDGQSTDNLSTRASIAKKMNISEGNVYKIKSIGDNNPELLALIDKKELSIHQAHELSKKPSTKPSKPREHTNGQQPQKYLVTCPNCGHQH